MGAPLGNQNGRQAKIWQQAIKRAIARRVNGVINDGLDKAADKFVDAVFQGEPWAFKEFGDRMDGKAGQQLTIDGDGDGGPVKTITEIVIRAVDA